MKKPKVQWKQGTEQFFFSPQDGDALNCVGRAGRGRIRFLVKNMQFTNVYKKKKRKITSK